MLISEPNTRPHLEATPSSCSFQPAGKVDYALRSDSMPGRLRSGRYSSSSFPIRNTVAAMMRAFVSLARLGFVPPASIRS